MDHWDNRNDRRGPRLRFVRPDGTTQAPTPAIPMPPRTVPSERPQAAERPERLGQRGLVAHAAWVPPLGEGQSRLALWAEAESEWPARRRHTTPNPDTTSRARSHPYSARQVELMALLERLWKTARPGVRPRSTCTPARLQLWLPATATRPLPSPELVRAAWAPDPALDPAPDGTDPAADAPLALWRVDGLLLDAESAGTLLAGLPFAPGAEAIAASAPLTSATTTTTRPAAAPRLLLGGDLRLWAAAGRLALDLLARQRYLPGATRLPDPPRYADPYGYSYGSYGYQAAPRIASLWFASLHDPADRARFDALAAAMPDLARTVLTPGHTNASPEAVPTPAALLEDFLHTVINARVERWLVQSQVTLNLDEPGKSGTGYTSPYDNPYVYGNAGSSSVTARWLWGLMTPNRPLYLSSDEAPRLLTGTQRWHAGLGGPGQNAFRLCFRLLPPEGWGEETASATETAETVTPSTDNGDDHDDAAAAASATPLPPALPRLIAEAPPGAPNGHHHDNHNGHNGADQPLTPPEPLQTLDSSGHWGLQFLLQARDDLSLLVPLEEVWREGGSTARFLDRRFDHPHEQVLASLGQAARLFAPIDASLHEAHPLGCLLTGAEAYLFLREALPLLEEAGFGVLVPGWWKRAAAKPTMRLKLKGMRKTSTGLMGLDAVVDYDWKLALGGEELSREDLERLAALKEPLVRLRGKWVELQPDQVDAALRFLAAHHTGKMTMGEALGAALTGQVGDEEVEIEEVSADEWIGDLLGRLRGGDTLGEVAPPDTLHGTLRPYQQRGLSWLAFLTRYGLGACLADDMGLGKSVQLLALMLHQKAQGALTKPVLLVCPTSVVGNWGHEVARFTPDLRVLVHHGAGRVGRAAAAKFAAEVANYDLVVTTYSLLPRDEATLAQAEWGAVVLDEAQNIKNAEAKQSRAARKLKAPVRVALTGTPVENRLAELWSIMDFLNGGYLGSHKRFHERFAYPVEKLRDPAATARLQALVRPFVLRRLKTDPTVISDLPDKIEVKEYCPLTREQVTLYEAVVRDGLRQIEEAGGAMKRRGIVLAMLSKLKQVCNHPAHFLGDASALEGRSGKLIRLEELIEELLAEGDRALIFTQFTAMGDRLQPYLKQRFGAEVLYLHGSVPRQQRDQMVARFQEEDGPPLFLLSLKAGGTGLNLTRANHVIHFDRWWNPAVENQATDRAFRIGQTRNVQVRKFVCTGTLEERIDAMIEQKRELAENVIGTGESWITEMSTTELRELFSLRAEALAE
ncbi:MAG TPA: SNF2-related protein [Ktedonobacterales bacterium]